MEQKSKEAIETLESNLAFIQEGVEHLSGRQVLQIVEKNTIQALALLKAEQPPASDKITLDKGSLTYCKEHKIIYLRKLPCPLCLQDRLDASEASRKELAEACEKVRDWLDTSSLQQVLVHYTEDKRKHALIMGIASHLEHLEVALAKAKETNIQTKEK